ncbi:MAG TPA: glycosyltransferase family 2 protein [Kofleriaceae bacterium]|nr:glycosyltransferase family 2 protein [Kofleriaceae bacterium]
MRACAIIPTYDNPATVAAVVEQVRRHLDDVLVVDDGSAPPARRIVDELAARGSCSVLRQPRNGGKGDALKAGLAWAREHGYDYAVSIDADLQHDAADIPLLLARVHEERETLVLGQPIFDESAPRLRLYARKISVFWAVIETLGRKIGDPLCGYRVYPVEAALRTRTRARAMDFEPEIAARLVWDGVAVEQVATRVVYVPGEAGGVSHFRVFTDTLLISLAHARLCVEGIWRLARWAARALLGRRRG